MMSNRHIVVFSGGSAANNLVDVFGEVAEDKSCSLSYIIPISDNGGSTSELIRVFGGPGIGDVRSRLVRLIPSTPSTTSEQTAIKALFNHRLSALPSLARLEWLDIVEARSPLWSLITSSKLELIRSFFNTLNLEITKRARPSSVFNFQSASIGNLFLTGARLFTGSFESAVYLLGIICGIPGNVSVIPAINSNFSHHISAGLLDGTIITGQNSISHPSAPSANPIPSTPAITSSPTIDPFSTRIDTNHPSIQLNDLEVAVESPQTLTRRFSLEVSLHDHIEDANLPGSLPSLRKQYIDFAKEHTEDLPSRIQKIWYINPYGQPIRPSPSPAVLTSLSSATSIIYSIGSLYTSIIPCLILRGVGSAIASASIKTKILILNGSLDRETRSVAGGEFNASDFVEAITEACKSSYPNPSTNPDTNSTSTTNPTSTQTPKPSDFITHVIHLSGPSTPHVDKTALSALGIESVKIYGRPNENGEGMVYDAAALAGALKTILGKGTGKGSGGRSRRNTVEM